MIGWREWLALPTLGIPKIKAKVDTGARTSALHTFDLEIYPGSNGQERVRFRVHPEQGNLDYIVECDEAVSTMKSVRDSGGHEEMRPFIRVPATIGNHTWDIEMSLTNRDNMKFRMLLGRVAMNSRFVVNPQKSFLMGTNPETSA